MLKAVEYHRTPKKLRFVPVFATFVALGLAASAEHPSLYFKAEDLPALRAARGEGQRAAIWKNIEKSAEWCLQKTPRTEYIAPAADDPIYENLYDRFYAMMGDMAITEHLALAYGISGEARYRDAAKAWTLGTCHAWRPDAEAAPDGGKAYAVCRMLKGVAVAYDVLYHDLSDAERTEIRNLLATTARTYFTGYFQLPEKSGPEFFTHHAVVEWSSFGIVALALLEEVPEARQWLEATEKKFRNDLLPRGLAPDGAQTEGATFWASTMHYRLFFMDALRRVTGHDLYKEFEAQMNADLALASIAATRDEGWDEPHQSVVLEPPYGQLDYYAPILLALASEYRRPIYQYLASWDHTLGQIQQTRYITPNRREQLLFELGGYAYLWYDQSVFPDLSEAPAAYYFPSVGQAYVRSSFAPGEFVAAMDDNGDLVVHAGGVPVFIASLPPREGAVPRVIHQRTLSAANSVAEGACIALLIEKQSIAEVTLEAADRMLIRCRGLSEPIRFWRYELPEQPEEKTLQDRRVRMEFLAGHITSLEAEGHRVELAVGNGLLKLPDPAPRAYPEVAVSPQGGEIALSIKLRSSPAP